MRTTEAIRYDEAEKARGRRLLGARLEEEAVEGGPSRKEDSEVEAAEHAVAAGGREREGARPSGAGAAPGRLAQVPVLLQILQPAGCREAHSPLRKEGQIRKDETQF